MDLDGRAGRRQFLQLAAAAGGRGYAPHGTGGVGAVGGPTVAVGDGESCRADTAGLR